MLQGTGGLDVMKVGKRLSIQATRGQKMKSLSIRVLIK